jgi:transposase
LYGQNHPLAEVLDVAGCCRASLMAWCQKYRAAGVAGLGDRRGGPQAAKLTPAEITTVGSKLQEYTPYDVLGPQAPGDSRTHWTVPALYLAIEKWFGVTYRSRTSYLNLFAACGFSYQRTEKVFKSRREGQVLDFESETQKK